MVGRVWQRIRWMKGLEMNRVGGEEKMVGREYEAA